MKSLLLLLVFALLLLLCLTGCTREVKEENLFYPRRIPQVDEIEGRTNVVIPLGKDLELGGWYLHHDTHQGELIYFYGNGETVYHAVHRLEWLARELQVNILAVDYRGYGFSDGTPAVQHLLDDAVTIYDHLQQQFNRAGNPVYIYGRSIGTAPAIQLADRRTIAGMILEAPFTSIDDVLKAWEGNLPGLIRWCTRLRPEPKLAALKEQPVDLIKRYRGPLLVLHGDQDTVIPYPLGKAMYAASPSPDKAFTTVKGIGHNNLSIAEKTPAMALKSFMEDCRQAK